MNTYRIEIDGLGIINWNALDWHYTHLHDCYIYPPGQMLGYAVRLYK